MRKLFYSAIGLSFVLALFLVATSAYSDEVVDLIAGQHMVVGTVTIEDDGTDLTITYAVDPPWMITETHLHVVPCRDDDNDGVPDGIPHTKSGNPKVGQFEYGDDYNPPVSGDEFVVPIPKDLGLEETLCIAAHAVVMGPCGDEIVLGNATADVEVLAPSPDGFCPPGNPGSIFSVSINGGPALPAWCAEYKIPNPVGDGYDVVLFEDEIWAAALSCLLNRVEDYLGMQFPYYNPVDQIDDTFEVCVWHIQYLIWDILFEIQGAAQLPSEENLRPKTAAQYEVFRDYVEDDCTGFELDCDSVIPIFIDPGSGPGDEDTDGAIDGEYANLQDLVILVPVCCETAWGDGDDFPGSNWFMFIEGYEPEPGDRTGSSISTEGEEEESKPKKGKKNKKSAPGKHSHLSTLWGKIKFE